MKGTLAKALVGSALVGAAGLAYAASEAHRYTLRRTDVPVLREGQPPLRLLHVSDLHLVPRQRSKRAWVRSLRALEPDAVVVTGDFLAHPDAVPATLEALDPLLGLPGAFVLGSNDYYAPRALNPAKYLQGPTDLDPRRGELPWPELVAGLTTAGWLDLSNSRAELIVAGRRIDLRGVDDPHIARDDYAAVSGPFDRSCDISIGVAHAPYLRVIDAMANDGADLILAGHTHGGQLRVPGLGALVTNCDLDRRRARGLSRHGSRSFLHVSAGLGTSPYAPVRFACPPEATLLTLTA